MPRSSLSIAIALAAAVVLPAQAQAEHEGRYFGFGYPPPPVIYPAPPRIREVAPGVYEYEVAPGRWVRARPGYANPPRRQPEQARRSPAPPPVPQKKPEDEPAVTVERSPVTTSPVESPDQAPVQSAAQEAPAAGGISCEAAADIVKSFGFSDVQSTSCSGDTYGFDGTRDGKAYSIKLSAADGELTEVSKR